MISRIGKAFQDAAERGESAFIPYMTAGFPDEETFMEIIRALDTAGADIIEVGLPFSDPLADGPVIQASSQKALENGMTPDKTLKLVARAGRETDRPIVIMSYFNPILSMGLEEFARKAGEAGAAGVIIPDLPPEEAGEWLEAAGPHGLETIFMAAPTTPPARSRMIAAASRGFLYYVSLTGVTGSDFAVSGDLLESVKALKAVSPVPVAVGFGVAGTREAGPLAAVADGVIVGSALIREVLSAPEGTDRVRAVAELAASIKGALGKEKQA